MWKKQFRIDKIGHESGKRWTTVAATVLTVIGTGTVIVHADDQPATSGVPEVTSGSKASLTGSQVTLSATTVQSSAALSDSTAQSVVATSSISNAPSGSATPSAAVSPASTTAAPTTLNFLASDDLKNDTATSPVSDKPDSIKTKEQATDTRAGNASEIADSGVQSAAINQTKPETVSTSPLTETTNLGNADDIVTATAKLVASVIYQQTGLPQKITRVGVPLVVSGKSVAVPPTDPTTHTVTFANPPSYKAYTWLDSDPKHFTFSQTAINDGGLIVVSTDRTGDGTVYVHELTPKTYHDDTTYTVKPGESVTSAKYGFTYNNQNYGVTLLNGQHYSTFMVQNSNGINLESDHVMWVPRLVKVTTNFVNEAGKAIKPKSVQQGLSWQEYTDTPPKISGYTLDETKLPKVQSGQLSLFGKGWSGTLDYGNGVTATYVQLTDEGDMDATVTDEHLFDNTKAKTPTTTQVFHFKAGDYKWQIYDYKDIHGWGGQIALENPAYGTPTVVTYVYSSNYSITGHKTVNETINYVNEQGATVAPLKKATAIEFLTVHDSSTKKDTVYYSITKSATTATIDPATGKPTGDGWKSDGASFAAVADPIVAGYHVLSTDALHSGLIQTAAQSVDSSSSDLVYKVIYAHNAVIPPTVPERPKPETFTVNTPTPETPVVPVVNKITPKTPSVPVVPSIVSTPVTPATPSKPATPVTPVSETPQPVSKEPASVSPTFGPIAVSNVSWLAPVKVRSNAHAANIPTPVVAQRQESKTLQHAAELPHTGERSEAGLVALGVTLLGTMGMYAGYRRRH